MDEGRPDLLSAYLKITEEIAYEYAGIVNESNYRLFISKYNEVLSYLGMCIASINQGNPIDINPLPAMSEINEILVDRHKIKNVDSKYFFIPDGNIIISDEKGWRHYKEDTIAKLKDISDEYESQEDLIRFANIDITGAYYLYPLYVQEGYAKNKCEDENIALAQIKLQINMPAFRERVIKQRSNNNVISDAIGRIEKAVNGNK